MINNLIYILWTSINLFQDMIYRYYSVNINFVLLGRYFLSLLLLTIGEFFLPVSPHKTSIKNLIFINFFKSISSFLGMIFGFLQLSKTNIFNTNLIFYNIPAMDYFFQKFFLKQVPLPPVYLTIINIFNSSLIIAYFAFNYQLKDYLYGFLSAMFFSLSNISILLSKNHWKNHLSGIFLDMKIFSCFMLVWTGIYVAINGLTVAGINWWSWGLLSINGVLMQFLLYYLFFKILYTPSSLMTYFDLFFSIGVDIFMTHTPPSFLQVLLLISIILIPHLFKKL
jgi:hypothetical protein